MSEKVQAVATVHQITAWSGPLPDPKRLVLEAWYNSVVSSFGHRIIQYDKDIVVEWGGLSDGRCARGTLVRRWTCRLRQRRSSLA